MDIDRNILEHFQITEVLFQVGNVDFNLLISLCHGSASSP